MAVQCSYNLNTPLFYSATQLYNGIATVNYYGSFMLGTLFVV